MDVFCFCLCVFVFGTIGNFSVVRECSRKTGDNSKPLAVKIIQKASLNQKDMDNITRDMAILQQVTNHCPPVSPADNVLMRFHSILS